MAAPKTTAERLAWKEEKDNLAKELTDKLEAGMKELFSSDKYKNFLKAMSNFHNYSSRNVMLIHQQMPKATRVASFKTWKDKFSRSPKRGEKSLRIWAPIEIKPEKKLMEKLDPETGAPMLDRDGKVIVEEMTALTNRSIAFKLVPVFDVSQTVGEPLPQLVEDLTGNVEHYEAFLDTLKAISPLPIVFEPMRDNLDGYCRYGEQIGIREGMSEIQSVSAIIHEITHARLHDKDKTAENEKPVSKGVKEIEAESVSYVVCQKYGIETGDNSFGYLASWGSHEMTEVKSSLDTIRKEANDLINAIDDRFKVLCKERGIDLGAAGHTADSAKPPKEAGKPNEPTYTTATTTENIAGVDFTVNEVVPAVPLSIEQVNYQKLAELSPETVNREYYYKRFEAAESMPLSFEWIQKDHLTVTHYPVTTFRFAIDNEAKTAKTADGESASKWLDANIGNDYKPTHGILLGADDIDPNVYFNADQKPYNMGFVYGQDGTMVYNRMDKTDQKENAFKGMAKIAFVDSYRDITFYEDRDKLPPTVLSVVTHVRLDNEKERPAEIAQPEPMQPEPLNEQPSEQAEQTEPMPDPSITPAERDAFGYAAEDMLPLGTERALELFNADHAVFLLYPDNTEAMAFDADEIEAHDGIFGIEREGWQKSREYTDMAADNKTNQQLEAEIESEFVNAKEDTFAIYQIMEGAENVRDYRYEGLDYLEKMGIEVSRNNYAIVHTEPLQDGQTLEGIFQKFNDPPKDFAGHSLTVSDVVVLNQGGEITSHYCDSFGFSELPAFLGVEKQQEQAAPEVVQIPDMPKTEQPIYRFSADHALKADEIMAFHESRNLNVECGRAIDAAVTANNYEMYRYDLKAAAASVIEEFGADRVAWVLASNVNSNDFDGRLSHTNKAWANEFETPKPDFYLQSHMILINGLVDRFQALEKEKPSLMAALDAGEKKSKAEFDGKAKPGLDAPDVSVKKKNTGMQQEL